MLKKLIITAILIIIIGVGGSIITYTSSNKSAEMNEIQSINYENIDSVQINSVSTDVEIIATKEQKNASIQLVGKTKEINIPELSVKAEGTKLVIDLKEGNTKNKWLELSPTFAPSTLVLKVYVPEKILNNIAYNSVSADLYLENMHANTIAFSNTSGDFDGRNLQFESATIQTVSGDVEIDELIGMIMITSESGDITMTMTDLIYPMQINSTSGDVEIVTENAPTDVEFKINSVSGNLNILNEFNKSTIIGNGTTLVEIQTTSADISVENY